LYLSDLEEYLSENYVNHLEFLNENCIQHIGMYLKLFLLFYSDDTFILAESTEDLHAALNIFEEYCSEWKLSIIVSKTKIVVFSKRKYNNKKEFLLNNEEVEVKESYTYLGLLFIYNGNFCQGRKKMVDKAQKALFALYRKNYDLAIPVDLQLKPFDSLVTPILL
jgi:hypothetical protein